MVQLSYTEVIRRHPLPEEDDFSIAIALLLKKHDIRIVILDDDPTGIQTVHGCLLLTGWKTENLVMALNDEIPFFYILTNSRSMVPMKVKKITQAIVQAIIDINRKYHYRLIFISRSDSTLRGYFPLEPDTICHTLQENKIPLNFPVFFIPAFFEAGRYTIDNIHYMKEDDKLIPVAQTEFAGDKVFGYKSSQLYDYIIEKSDSKINRKQIGSVSLSDLRKNPAEEIIEIFKTFKNSKYVIINALDYYDLKKFSLLFLNHFTLSDTSAVLRTSSSLPKALSGIEDIHHLSGNDIIKRKGPGIIIVGSHVNKTTIQLKSLLKHPEVNGVEVDVNEILTGNDKQLKRILQLLSGIYSNEKTPVVYTSRQELSSENHAERLFKGKKISAFLADILRNLPYAPAYIVTKGGITSHDMLTDALEIKYARVMGQLIEGVPVIMAGEKHRLSDIPFIIFPGNVGNENSLKEAFQKLIL